MDKFQEQLEIAENSFSVEELNELTSEETLRELANMEASFKLAWLKDFYIKVRPALKTIATWLFWRPKLKMLVEAFIIAMDEIFGIKES